MARFFFEGHTYEFVAAARTWQDASTYAQAQGGHLAVITSASENNAIIQAALADTSLISSAPTANDGGGAKYLWLGATDVVVEGRFAWVTGESFSLYSAWATGPLGREPDDFGGAQDALAMALEVYPRPSGGIGSAGLWNDVNERNTLSFVIEYDELRGTEASETIQAGAGADTVRALAGDDTISGGGGENYLRGDEGNDSIVGGAGFDDINGNRGNDTCVSGGGDDWVVGGKDNDSLSGSDGQNLVYGNLGNDTCDGGAGNDTVRGGQDNDVVIGGAGDDYVSGDKGSDTMTGGIGADIFHSFGDAGIDRVTDFSLAQGDRVQLDPGTVFTLSQVGADTIVNMTGGGQMTLVGIQLSSLTGNWIFGA